MKITLDLIDTPNDIVESFQAFIKIREKKSLNKAQIINRIIREWGEDRHLTVEYGRKSK